MKLSFIVNPIMINGGFSPWDKRVGGSEECVIEWSKRLVEKGHQVTVYHNGKHGMYKGVTYRGYADYEESDVTIAVNCPDIVPKGRAILWTSLTEHPELHKFNAVCAISNYAKENTGIEHRNVHLVPPGYDDAEIYKDIKRSKQCLYASSPDRGLDTLLRAWPEVVGKHPDAELIVTYGAQEYDLPNTTFIDATEEEMNVLYRESEVWCHPANGGELYSMAGKKAQVSGCIPVIIPIMALKETVRNGIFATEENYADKLIEVLSMPYDEMEILSKKVIEGSNALTWEQSTTKLLQVIDSVL